jgi:hypothetical protein
MFDAVSLNPQTRLEVTFPDTSQPEDYQRSCSILNGQRPLEAAWGYIFRPGSLFLHPFPSTRSE